MQFYLSSSNVLFIARTYDNPYLGACPMWCGEEAFGSAAVVWGPSESVGGGVLREDRRLVVAVSMLN